MPIDEVLSRLTGVRRSGKGWVAKCPAHNDRRASLSISEGRDGRVLLFCHAGCALEAIVDSLGLEVRALFPDTNGSPRDVKSDNRPKRQADAQLFDSPEAAIQAVRQVQRINRPPDHTWEYRDRNGQAVGLVLRWDLDGGKLVRPVSRRGSKWAIGTMEPPRPLYNLPKIAAADRVVVVEGEKCCDAAETLGLVPTTSAGGASAAHLTDWSPLAGKDVWILPDADDAGRRYAKIVAGILAKLEPPARVRIVELPGLGEGGDIADWVQKHATLGVEALRQQLEALAQAAKPTQGIDSASGGSSAASADDGDLLLSEVKEQPVDWLWENRIPMGFLTVLAGRQGQGKSLVCADIAARVTLGCAWPAGGSNAPQGEVVIVNLEDDPARVLKPRLRAAGADLAKVRVVTSPITTSELPRLNRILDRCPNCKLLVVDPAGNHLGGGVDVFRDNVVREALSSLTEIARERNIAVVLVCHLRKSNAETADDRVLGSVAFTALARSVLHVIPGERPREGERILAAGKANLSRAAPAVKFTIMGNPPVIAWGEVLPDLDADEILAARKAGEGAGRPPHELQEATEFLKSMLSEGARSARDVLSQARAAGISQATLRRAKEALEVRARQVRDGWTWELPATGKGEGIPSLDQKKGNVKSKGVAYIHAASIRWGF